MNKFESNWVVLKERQKQEDYQQMNSWQRVRFNCNFLVERRSGDYLIKQTPKHPWFVGGDNMYVDFSYVPKQGYLTTSTRKCAAWFTGREAQEFIRGKKGFKIVKR
jgi:hypothetical protein